MLLSIFDIEALIRYGGLFLIAAAVFCSTGLFFCFFIPSGAFLFAGGIFSATGVLDAGIVTTCMVLTGASVLGNLTGYLFGRKTGPLLYRRPDSRFFKKQHLITAETFYKKYGWLALTLGLYLPIIRTFAPIVAGIIRLEGRRFFILTLAGSLVWIPSFVLTGYLVGSQPFLKPWLKYIVMAFIIAVTIPLIIWTRKELKGMRKEQKDKTGL